MSNGLRTLEYFQLVFSSFFAVVAMVSLFPQLTPANDIRLMIATGLYVLVQTLIFLNRLRHRN